MYVHTHTLTHTHVDKFIECCLVSVEAVAAQLSLCGLTGQCVAAREMMNEKLFVWRFESDSQ